MDVIQRKDPVETGAGSANPSPVATPQQPTTPAKPVKPAYSEGARPVIHSPFGSTALQRTVKQIGDAKNNFYTSLAEDIGQSGGASAVYSKIPHPIRIGAFGLSSLTPLREDIRALGSPNPWKGVEFQGKSPFGKFKAGVSAHGVLMPVLANTVGDATELSLGLYDYATGKSADPFAQIGQEGSAARYGEISTPTKMTTAIGDVTMNPEKAGFNLSHDTAVAATPTTILSNTAGVVAQYAVQDAAIIAVSAIAGGILGGLFGILGGPPGILAGAIAGGTTGAGIGADIAGTANLVSLAAGTTGAAAQLVGATQAEGSDLKAQMALLADQSAQVSNEMSLLSPVSWMSSDGRMIFDNNAGWTLPSGATSLSPQAGMMIGDNVTNIFKNILPGGEGAYMNSVEDVQSVWAKRNNNTYIISGEGVPNQGEVLDALRSGHFIVQDSNGGYHVDEIALQQYQYMSDWLKNPQDRLAMLNQLYPQTEVGKSWVSSTSDRNAAIDEMLYNPYVDPKYFESP